MSHEFNQKGFAAVEAVLIVVILAVIGGTGFYVYHANHKTNQTLNAAAKDADGAPKVAKKSVTNQSVTTAIVAPLVIKEWAVQIPLDKVTTGAYYKFDTTDSSQNQLYVMTPTSDAIANSRGVSCKGEYVAILARTSNTDFNPNGDGTDSNPPPQEYKQIGSYTYSLYTHKTYGPDCYDKNGTAGDFEVDQSVADKFQVVVVDFTKEFPTISKT